MTNIAQLASVQLSNAFTIDTNADFRGQIALASGVDLTGIVFKMQIRPLAGSTVLVADLTTANGALTGDASGNLHYQMLAAQTKMLTPYVGSAIADILAEGDGWTLNLCPSPLAVTIAAGVTNP